VVDAYVQATTYVHDHAGEAAALAHQYIGIDPSIIEKALQVNRPSVDALRNTDAMEKILGLMQSLGYIRGRPKNFVDLSFLDRALAASPS
jgi:hypothetical protein